MTYIGLDRADGTKLPLVGLQPKGLFHSRQLHCIPEPGSGTMGFEVADAFSLHPCMPKRFGDHFALAL